MGWVGAAVSFRLEPTVVGPQQGQQKWRAGETLRSGKLTRWGDQGTRGKGVVWGTMRSCPSVTILEQKLKATAKQGCSVSASSWTLRCATSGNPRHDLMWEGQLFPLYRRAETQSRSQSHREDSSFQLHTTSGVARRVSGETHLSTKRRCCVITAYRQPNPHACQGCPRTVTFQSCIRGAKST